MFLFRKKKKEIKQPKLRQDSPEVIAAKEYLDKTHPTLLGRDSTIAHICGNYPFNYLESSQNGEYTRYHFCQGVNKRIIYIVLSDEEREKIIQMFTEKMKDLFPNYADEFVYKDSLKGMFVGEQVKHRFFHRSRENVAFMSDSGNIDFPPILHSEDMD